MIITQLNDTIDEQAKNESIRKVGEYAPSSYKAGYADGARWMREQMKKTEIIVAH